MLTSFRVHKISACLIIIQCLAGANRVGIFGDLLRFSCAWRSDGMRGVSVAESGAEKGLCMGRLAWFAAGSKRANCLEKKSRVTRRKHGRASS